MTDKVLCPWCGSEMWYPDSPWKKQQPEMGGYMYRMHGKCRHCEAMTPAAYGRTPEEAVNAFFAAALRRYEPPTRPLTLERVFELSREEGNIIYLEYREKEAQRRGYNGYYEPHYVIAYNAYSGCSPVVDFYAPGTETERTPDPAAYDIGWRCWPRKPTEEERKEAKWDDG